MMLELVTVTKDFKNYEIMTVNGDRLEIHDHKIIYFKDEVVIFENQEGLRLIFNFNEIEHISETC